MVWFAAMTGDSTHRYSAGQAGAAGGTPARAAAQRTRSRVSHSTSWNAAYEQAVRDLEARQALHDEARPEQPGHDVRQHAPATRQTQGAVARQPQGGALQLQPQATQQQTTRQPQAAQPQAAQQQHPTQAPAGDAARGRYDASNYAARSGGAHSKRRRRAGRGKPLAVAGCVVAIALVAAAVLVAGPFNAGEGGSDASDTRGVFASISTSGDEEEGTASLPTPIMAESEGLELHCAVAVEDLTEILIHNASYSYACAITTELSEATNTEVMENHGTGRVASEQPTGDEWLTGEFIRCYRSGNAGPKMSAIDCGAEAGSTVYAPVSGTVVLVKEYQLYDAYEDYQIHIQPEGREDLDVVLIHVENVCVEAGDTVEAGVTEIAEVRDVYAYIGGSMQLKDYTAEDDDGNHTHIQVNDATDESYTGLDDLKKSSKKSGKKDADAE